MNLFKTRSRNNVRYLTCSAALTRLPRYQVPLAKTVHYHYALATSTVILHVWLDTKLSIVVIMIWLYAWEAQSELLKTTLKVLQKVLLKTTCHFTCYSSINIIATPAMLYFSLLSGSAPLFFTCNSRGQRLSTLSLHPLLVLPRPTY